MLKLKVCGLSYPDNAKEIIASAPDFAGFIFFPGSKRYCKMKELPPIPESITPTAVFVNATAEEIMSICTGKGISTVQLHGAEQPQFCELLKEKGLTVIKAFGIEDLDSFSVLDDYKDVADYYLLDTKTPQHGGSGYSFNWELLRQVVINKPFFLSGGIGPESIHNIREIQKIQPLLFGIDINSRFEVMPGWKDVQKVIDFKRSLGGI